MNTHSHIWGMILFLVRFMQIERAWESFLIYIYILSELSNYFTSTRILQELLKLHVFSYHQHSTALNAWNLKHCFFLMVDRRWGATAVQVMQNERQLFLKKTISECKYLHIYLLFFHKKSVYTCKYTKIWNKTFWKSIVLGIVLVYLYITLFSLFQLLTVGMVFADPVYSWLKHHQFCGQHGWKGSGRAVQTHSWLTR